MRTKRQILAMALTFGVITLGCAGCGGQNSQPGSSQESSQVSTQADSQEGNQSDGQESNQNDSQTSSKITKENALERILDAVTVGTIVNKYGSFEQTDHCYLQDNDVYRYEEKESDLCYVCFPEIEELVNNNNEILFALNDMGYVHPMYIDDYIGEKGTLLEENLLKDIVTDISEEGDRIIVKTETSKEDTQSVLDVQGDSDFYKEGDWLTAEYTLSAADDRLYDYSQTLHHSDGTTEEAHKIEIKYDVECPEAFKTLYESYKEHTSEQTEDVRYTTVTVNPGTEQEKDYSSVIPKEDVGGIILHDKSKTYHLYADRECTQPFERKENSTEDVHIYAVIEAADGSTEE